MTWQEYGDKRHHIYSNMQYSWHGYETDHELIIIYNVRKFAVNHEK